MTDRSDGGGDLPRWVTFALRIVLPADTWESMAGDLLEEYQDVVRTRVGPLRAHLWFARQVASLVTVASPRVEAGAWLGSGAVLLFGLTRWAGPQGRVPLPVLFGLAFGLAANALVALPSARQTFSPITAACAGALAGVVLSARYLAAFGHWPPGETGFGFAWFFLPTEFVTSVALIVLLLAAGFLGAWLSARVRVGALVAMAASLVGWILSVAFVCALYVRATGTLRSVATLDTEVLTMSVVFLSLAAVLGTVGAMLGKGTARLSRSSRERGGAAAR